MNDKTKYRLYEDGTVVHQDDFWEYDNEVLGYQEYDIPDSIVNGMNSYILSDEIGDYIDDHKIPHAVVLHIIEEHELDEAD